MAPGAHARLLDLSDAAAPHRGLAQSLAVAVASDPELPPPDQLTLGRLQHAMLKLHAETFGGALECLAACTACGNTLEFAVPVAAVERGVRERVVADVDVGVDGVRFGVQAPTVADVLQQPPADGAARTADALARRCVLRAERDGVPLEPGAFPAGWRAAVADAVAALDPLADFRVTLDCVVCGQRDELTLDIAGFVARKIQAEAAIVIDEVHRLASAYGWTEPEILALSRARREAYLRRLDS
jgi:hypothetical protein